MRNFQKELDILTEKIGKTGQKPSLLLHACCAPCASYCMEYLSRFFRITLFFYNPNMDSAQEYEKRLAELKRLIDEIRLPEEASRPELKDAGYDPESFLPVAKGLENEPERGERCRRCYALRLKKTASLAAERGFDYFCTTLSISPMKDAVLLNEIGERLAADCNVLWLPSDFKKREGYKRSIELSREYGLYRQDYCGCRFSRRENEG